MTAWTVFKSSDAGIFGDTTMIEWKLRVTGESFEEYAEAGEYRFEVTRPYKKEPPEWYVYFQKKLVGRDKADSVVEAKRHAVYCKVEHEFGMEYRPGFD